MNFYKLHKLALKGNEPRMDSLDRYRNHYVKRKPENGEGTALNTPGSEETNPGSFGGNAREGYPDDVSAVGDNYDTQRKETIPASPHMFIGGEGEGDKAPLGEGVGGGNQSQPFVDSREKYIDMTNREPVGPHNMQRYRTVIDRTWKKLHTEN